MNSAERGEQSPGTVSAIVKRKAVLLRIVGVSLGLSSAAITAYGAFVSGTAFLAVVSFAMLVVSTLEFSKLTEAIQIRDGGLHIRRMGRSSNAMIRQVERDSPGRWFLSLDSRRRFELRLSDFSNADDVRAALLRLAERHQVPVRDSARFGEASEGEA